MQKVYEKLLAHPLFISDYVVYHARVARTFYIGLAPVCVCVCVYTIIWIDQINRHKKWGKSEILLCRNCYLKLLLCHIQNLHLNGCKVSYFL